MPASESLLSLKYAAGKMTRQDVADAARAAAQVRLPHLILHIVILTHFFASSSRGRPTGRSRAMLHVMEERIAEEAAWPDVRGPPSQFVAGLLPLGGLGVGRGPYQTYGPPPNRPYPKNAPPPRLAILRATCRRAACCTESKF